MLVDNYIYLSLISLTSHFNLSHTNILSFPHLSISHLPLSYRFLYPHLSSSLSLSFNSLPSLSHTYFPILSPSLISPFLPLSKAFLTQFLFLSHLLSNTRLRRSKDSPLSLYHRYTHFSPLSLPSSLSHSQTSLCCLIFSPAIHCLPI